MANYDSEFTGAQIDAAITKANSATQPGDLGTAAATATTDYATAAQGELADSATQPGDISLMVVSDPTGVTGADAVANIMSLTQAEYNAISTPNAATIYLILGETNALYLGTTALFSSGFSPTLLFAGGQQGLLFEPEG